MIIKDIYNRISDFKYSSLHDMFDACDSCVYVFALLKRLDIDWKSVEKNLEYNAKYLKIDKDRFFICCKKDYPFLLMHHNEFLDFYEVHCTDVPLYEDYFMPEISKYAIRWNICEYSSSLDAKIKLFSDPVIQTFLEVPEEN